MGDELKATRELEGLKEQMDTLSEYFEENGELLDGTWDSDTIALILSELAEGRTAADIIERNGLTVE